jgi:hypothetical protein
MMTIYRIHSRVELPARMRGAFDFTTAYDLCCDWNRRRPAEEMASIHRGIVRHRQDQTDPVFMPDNTDYRK